MRAAGGADLLETGPSRLASRNETYCRSSRGDGHVVHVGRWLAAQVVMQDV
jgi:hypothetical protein